MELKVKWSLSLPLSILSKESASVLDCFTYLASWDSNVPIFIRGDVSLKMRVISQGGIQANCTLALEMIELVAMLQVALFLLTFQWLVTVHFEE